MSQYNVFVGEEGITVFDWPQAVSIDHANAGELLERDVSNLVGYFRRKHPGEVLETDTGALARAITAGEFTSVSEFERT
jgi:RIO kinase 2